MPSYEKVWWVVCLIAALVFVVPHAKADNFSYFEFSQGITIHNAPWGDCNWIGKDPTQFELGHYWDVNRSVYIKAALSHTSNIMEGPPFNQEMETWLDQAKVVVGVKW